MHIGKIMGWAGDQIEFGARDGHFTSHSSCWANFSVVFLISGSQQCTYSSSDQKPEIYFAEHTESMVNRTVHIYTEHPFPLACSSTCNVSLKTALQTPRCKLVDTFVCVFVCA